MRGTLVKRIRRVVYGDYSIRERDHNVDPSTGMVKCVGLRAYYQRVKKEVKRDATFLGRLRK